MATTRCPCLSGETYDDCCGPLHDGTVHAPTAVQLMRSRYSAFAVGDADYLLRTWHPTTRPADLDLDPAVRWTRLDVLDVRAGGPFDTTGTVEFRAHHRVDGARGSQHEVSRFVREDGRWLYVGPLAAPS
ncbi:YchJ family metal-binding protein [Cellulomonas sp. ATA003]|uniref:YchJ family protein n=1 Tax=Cellulomonas sp. ATA003 TaxID=3073064 RepID=UPI002872DD1F|nr:YchJ family metal-binding protein [Cellulomonas sp. ATA003]WNB85131.1 YchJ family metal-binding protein [Cellulomonas sp. ATA003]